MKDIQNSGKRFVYFYFNRNEPEKIKQVVPDHVQYWKTAKLKGYKRVDSGIARSNRQDGIKGPCRRDHGGRYPAMG